MEDTMLSWTKYTERIQKEDDAGGEGSSLEWLQERAQEKWDDLADEVRVACRDLASKF